MTFFGINITPQLNLINPETREIIKHHIIDKALFQILEQQMRSDFVNLQTNFNSLAKYISIFKTIFDNFFLCLIINCD